MKRTMTLELKGFGREALEEQASRYALSPEELVSRAARYFIREPASGRAARRLPRFRRVPVTEGDLELELDLEATEWEELGEQSRREGVAVELLLEHAVLYLVADLDSGRAVAAIQDDEPTA